MLKTSFPAIRSVLPCSFRKLMLSFLLVCLLLSDSLSLAQSGRGRKRVEPPPPQPQPSDTAKPAAPLPAGAFEKQETDGLNSRFVLRNGLTLIISEDHSKPLLSLVACAKVGYAADGDTPPGVALAASELFWRGTISRGGIPTQTELQAIGAQTSVRVERTRTYFQMIAPSDQADRAAQVLVDALMRPNLDPSEIQRACRIVSQESRALSLAGASASSERMFATAFAPHWMQKSRLVSEEALRAVTREQIESFSKTFYQPARLVISVAGDVNGFQLVPVLQRGLAELKPLKSASSTTSDLPSQGTLRYAAQVLDGLDGVYVAIGYRLAQVSQADYPAVQLLQAILTGGLGSRLGRILRNGKHQVREINSELVAWSDAPTLAFQLSIENDKLDDAEMSFFAEIEKVRREVPSQGDMQRAVSVLELAHYQELQRVEGRATRLARAEADLGGYKEDFKLFSKIPAVTGAQLQRLAARIFAFSNSTVFEALPPELSVRAFSAERYQETVTILVPPVKETVIPSDQVRNGEAIATVEQGIEKRASSESSRFALSLLPKPTRTYPTLRGPTVFVREDTSLPLLTIGVFFQGGRAVEGENEEGLTELMLRSMLAGTKNRTARDISLQIEQLAASIQVVNEPDYFGFLLDVVTRNAAPAFAILHDIIEAPAFEKEAVARAIQEQLAGARRARTEVNSRSGELFWTAVLPRHPYGRSPFGNESIIKSATPELVKTWHASAVQRQFPLGLIIGDTEGSALVSRFFADGFTRREALSKLQLPIPNIYAGEHLLAEQIAGDQSIQVLGYLTGKGDSGDVYALAAIREMARPRLDLEVIDRLGVAQSVAVEDQQRLLGGAFTIKVVSAAANEGAARNAVMKEVEDLAATDIGDDVLQRARINAATDMVAATQTHHDRALVYVRAAMLSRRPDSIEQYSDRLAAIAKADVKRVLSDYFRRDRMGLGVLRGKPSTSPRPREEKSPNSGS